MLLTSYDVDSYFETNIQQVYKPKYNSPTPKTAWALKVHVKINFKGRESKAAPEKTSRELEGGSGRCTEDPWNPRVSSNAKCMLRYWYYSEAICSCLSLWSTVLFLCGATQAEQVTRRLELLPLCSCLRQIFDHRVNGASERKLQICRTKPALRTFRGLW